MPTARFRTIEPEFILERLDAIETPFAVRILSPPAARTGLSSQEDHGKEDLRDPPLLFLEACELGVVSPPDELQRGSR
jgi:hypothetical protein